MRLFILLSIRVCKLKISNRNVLSHVVRMSGMFMTRINSFREHKCPIILALVCLGYGNCKNWKRYGEMHSCNAVVGCSCLCWFSGQIQTNNAHFTYKWRWRSWFSECFIVFHEKRRRTIRNYFAVERKATLLKIFTTTYFFTSVFVLHKKVYIRLEDKTRTQYGYTWWRIQDIYLIINSNSSFTKIFVSQQEDREGANPPLP